jgi:hypothetical protein
MEIEKIDFDGQFPDLKAKDKALIYCGSSNWWNLKMSLETAMRMKEKNLDFDYLIINSRFDKYFEVNKFDIWVKWRFRNPVKKVERILCNLKIKTKVINIATLPKRDYPVESELDLENLKVFQHQVGKIIKASVSGILKKSNFEIAGNKNLIKKHIEACYVLIPLFNKILQTKPKCVFVSNDRYFPNALFALIAKSLKIDVVVAYWGSSADNIVYIKNSLFDFKQWHNLVDSFSTKFPLTIDKQKKLVQDDQFFKLTKNIFQRNNIFQKNFKPGLVLKSEFKKKLVFFSGSSWEFSGLTELPPDSFSNQYEALEFILSHLHSEEWDVILRHHPIPYSNPEMFESELWDKCRNYDNFSEIAPSSQIDSYELVTSSDLVVVYNSTIGLESLCMGKATVVFGTPYWINQKWGIWANSKFKAIEILNEPIKSVDRSELVKPLRFLKFFGSKFKFIENNTTNIKLLENYIYLERIPMRNTLKLLKTIYDFVLNRRRNYFQF